MSYFYGVYPNNEGFKVFLSLIRYIAEPDAIRFGHITLRGPYERKLDSTKLAALNAMIRDRPTVHLTNPIEFFEQNQNTVAINVEIDALRDLWYKPHYPMGLAHITLYDGASRSDAARLLDVLHCYRWSMEVSVTPLKMIEPKISDKDGFLKLAAGIYRAYSKFDSSRLPDINEVRLLGFSDRLQVISELLSQSNLSKSSPPQLARA